MYKEFLCAGNVIEEETIRTKFVNADLTNVKFGISNDNEMQIISFVDFSYANLTNSNLTNVQFYGCNFKNTILILTTNIGGENLTKKKVGFGTNKEKLDNEEEIKFFFKPEFRNRLDSIITFNSLTPQTVQKIVNKFINQLEDSLKEKNISIVLDSNVKNFLVKNGYSEIFGARPLSRLIQLKIKEPIADYLLSNSKFKSKILIRVSMIDDNKLKFNFITKKKKEKLIS